MALQKEFDVNDNSLQLVPEITREFVLATAYIIPWRFPRLSIAVLDTCHDSNFDRLKGLHPSPSES